MQSIFKNCKKYSQSSYNNQEKASEYIKPMKKNQYDNSFHLN